MQHIGLLCNCSTTRDPTRLSTAVLNRAVLLERRLRPAGLGLFLYSPRTVTGDGAVDGYTVDDGTFVPARRELPLVNANWTSSTRRLVDRGMGYTRFKRWVADRGVGIYSPYEFSELVSNKRKAYELVHELDPALHPHTEDYLGAPAQVASFLDRAPLVFVKPRAGNRGNAIFVLGRTNRGVSLTYYEGKRRRVFPALTLTTALGMIDVPASEHAYILQDGIESLRHDGAVFDVRLVMINDGQAWHAVSETRVAPPDSHLSNVAQGGVSVDTETLLVTRLGRPDARALQQKILQLARVITADLDARYPSQLIEIGYDFVLDVKHAVHVVEVNAKPGLVGVGSDKKHSTWQDDDRDYARRYVEPHVAHLATFLTRKATGAPSSGAVDAP